MDFDVVVKTLGDSVPLSKYEDIFRTYSSQYFQLIETEFPLVDIRLFKEESMYPYVAFFIKNLKPEMGAVADLKKMLPNCIMEVQEIVRQLKKNYNNKIYEKYYMPLIYEDYRSRYLQWCDTVSNNDYCDFLNFPFFECIRGYTQVGYLFKELRIKVMQIIINSENSVSFLPEDTISRPFFAIGNADMQLIPSIIDSGKTVAFSYENVSEDGKRVRITVAEVPVPTLKEMSLEEQERQLALISEEVGKSKKLTSFDAIVLQVIYQHLNALNIHNSAIYFTYGKFAEECFQVERNLHESDYNKIETSLKKLSTYSIAYEAEDVDTLSIGHRLLYLSGYDIKRNKSKEDGAKDYNYSASLEIYISENFRNEWLKAKNYEIFTSIYKQVSDATQRLLLFPLQRERLRVLASKAENKSVLEFLFFLRMVDYSGEKKYFKRILKNHLDELKEKGILIKEFSFYRTKHVVIEWLELTDLEREVYEIYDEDDSDYSDSTGS